MTWKVDKIIFNIINSYWSVQMIMLYKWKTNKMWSVNQFNSDKRMLKDNNKWQKETIVKKNVIKTKLI